METIILAICLLFLATAGYLLHVRKTYVFTYPFYREVDRSFVKVWKVSLAENCLENKSLEDLEFDSEELAESYCKMKGWTVV